MAMRIKLDGLQFCDDCLIVAVNGDYSGIDEHYGRGLSPGRGELRDGAKERAAEIDAGLAKYGPHLVPNFDSESGRGVSEFSSTWCDCCGSKLAGGRHEFAVLEPVPVGYAPMTNWSDDEVRTYDERKRLANVDTTHAYTVEERAGEVAPRQYRILKRPR